METMGVEETMTFIVPGIPVPKARARVMRGGWSFTPKKTREAEERVRLFATVALKGVKDSILGPECKSRLYVRVIAFGARMNADLDNCYKLVTDAMQGLVYKNDSQIDQAEMLREPCEKGKERTEVTIEAIL